MKSKLLIPLIICVISDLSAFAQTTTYLTAGHEETTADKAFYTRKKAKTDSGWQVTDYFLSGKTAMTGFYTDDSCKIGQGEFAMYDDSGLVYDRYYLVQKKAEGKETLYYSNGIIRAEGTNRAGKRSGEWAGFFPSGKLSGKAKFEDGNQVSASFFHEDGTPDETPTIFWRDADYPGGPHAWIRYLSKTMRYPEKAVNNNIQGTVVIGFNVKKDGSISDIKVVQSAGKELDNEALRVIKHTDTWDPLIIGGIVSESFKKQPIIFKLENF
jgi:TonB family protein